MSALNSTVRPKLADVYFDWGSEEQAPPQPGTEGTVAVVATSDWGPVNQAVTLTSWDGPASSDPTSPGGYLGTYGSTNTDLGHGVLDAFTGQGASGFGGAGVVVAYRIAGTSAAKATLTLQNSAGTPADALQLTAKYPGSRANDLRVTVQASATTGKDELVVLDGAVVSEKFDYAEADLASLASQIALLSDWWDAEVLEDGTALALVSTAAPTGGDDGATVTGQDWTSAQDALDRQRWQYFPAFKVTDDAIRASIVAWLQSRNTNGQRCMGIFGGELDEDLSTAADRTAAINDYNMINLGMGRLTLTDQGRDVSTSEFVCRYAGARSFRGESMGDIFVRFANVDVLNGPSLTEEATALDLGVVVFSRDTDATAPVYIREAKNTYVDDSVSPLDSQTGLPEHPQDLYSVIKNIAIQQGIELEIGDWGRSGQVLGDLPVDDKTRQIVLGRIQTAYSNRESAQVVQPGWTVTLAAGQTDDDDYISYVHGFHPTRSLRQILNQARIG